MRQVFITLAVVGGLGLASSGQAFTAGGGGSAAISGYRVAGVEYASANGGSIDRVSFSVEPASARVVRVSLDGASWTDCSNTNGSVKCDLAVPVERATALRVSAYE